jgi:DNA-binding CsgD family transcriptional regulator
MIAPRDVIGADDAEKLRGACAANSRQSRRRVHGARGRVLSWVARGATDAAIADRLGIAPATIEKHLESAYAKAGAHSRSDAIARILFGRASGRG